MCGYILSLFHVFDGVNLWCHTQSDLSIVYKNNTKFPVDFLRGVFFFQVVQREDNVIKTLCVNVLPPHLGSSPIGVS